ncbi:MAG: S26 family signal peptidase [Thermoplasmata archaeon]
MAPRRPRDPPVDEEDDGEHDLSDEEDEAPDDDREDGEDGGGDGEEDDGAAPEEEEDGTAERRRAPPSARRAAYRVRRLPPRPIRRASARPLRRWRREAPEEEDEEDAEAELEAAQREFLRAKAAAAHPRARYWRFRDSFWFGPVVAVLVLAVLLGSLVAVTGNWPPAYVIQSDSMQHGPGDVIGVINTGDIVFAQKVPVSSIVPYVVGMLRGYATYGEYGDVLIYLPDGQAATPVIHRALVYIDYSPSNGTYSAPSLAGLPCGASADAVYRVSGSPTGCGAQDLRSGETLQLLGVGWRSATVNISVGAGTLGTHSGFVTMGDYNLANRSCSASCFGITDQADGLSQLVEPSWILGVARGMLPWFGALRLALEGDAASVPAASWAFLAVSVIGFLLAAFALHYAWSSFRPADPRRAAATGEGDDEPWAPPRRSFWARFRRSGEDDRGPAEGTRRRASSRPRPERAEPRPGQSHPSLRRGRPRPSIRRGSAETRRPEPQRRRRADPADDGL